MNPIHFETQLKSSFDSAIELTTEALKKEGFGILTRIDFDQKIKEKLGHTLPRTAILGACNPAFAYEGYKKNPDMLLLVPCNVVVEEQPDHSTRVKFVKPSSMVSSLKSEEMESMAKSVDATLKKVADSLQEK